MVCGSMEAAILGGLVMITIGFYFLCTRSLALQSEISRNCESLIPCRKGHIWQILKSVEYQHVPFILCTSLARWRELHFFEHCFTLLELIAVDILVMKVVPLQLDSHLKREKTPYKWILATLASWLACLSLDSLQLIAKLSYFMSEKNELGK